MKATKKDLKNLSEDFSMLIDPYAKDNYEYGYNEGLKVAIRAIQKLLNKLKQ